MSDPNDPWEFLEEDEEMLEALYAADADERYKCPVCRGLPIRTGPVDDTHMYVMCMMGHVITRHYQEEEDEGD